MHTLLVLGGCLYPINVKTAEHIGPKFLCGTSHDPRVLSLFVFELNCRKSVCKKFLQICKHLCKIINNLMSFLGKTENTEISFAFFAELLQSASLYHRLSKNYQIWQLKWGQSKDLVLYRRQSFRQCAWGLRQFQHFNSFRPILFELCKKKLQGLYAILVF